MKTTIVLALGLALSGTLLAAGVTSSGGQPPQASGKQETRQLSRKQAVYELVLKWGPAASRAQGRDIHAWADSLVPLFGTADVANLNKALSAKTYTGMVNTLTGTRAPSTAKLPAGITPASLGAMTEDLVYTPLPSCVIVNTTKPGSGGAMTAGSARHLKASGASFVTQGGEDSNCGIPTGVRALLVSVTSATPSTSGYFRLWPYGTSEPLAANMSYTGGQLIQNEIVMATSVGLVADFSVRSSGNSHLIVNVLGYFAAPITTQLECALGPQVETTVIAGATGTISAACPAGYAPEAQVQLNCWSSSADGLLYRSWFNTCYYKNFGAATTTIFARANCCRIPGR